MITDKIALRELRDKVAEGTFIMDVLPRHEVEAYNAFCGSLDAAKALHEAILPGWRWSVAYDDWACVWKYEVDGTFEARSDNPARAWLLAQLDALIQEATDD